MPSWIGPWEIAIVVVLILLIFGPRKLPELGSSLGKSIRGFKKGLKETQDEVKTAVAEVREATDIRETGVKTEAVAAPAAPAAVAAVAPTEAAVAPAAPAPAAEAVATPPVAAAPVEAVAQAASVAVTPETAAVASEAVAVSEVPVDLTTEAAASTEAAVGQASSGEPSVAMPAEAQKAQ